MSEILFLIIGIVVGGVVAYLFFVDRKVAKKNESIVELTKNLARAEAEKDALSEKLNDEKERNNEEIKKLHEQMNTLFENTANKIFEKKSQDFVNTNKEKIGELLNPLKEKIESFQKKVEETYSNETRERASLKEAIKYIGETNQKMMQEANNLTRALKGDSKTQGNWGEFQLKTLLEISGLVEGVNFYEQPNYKTETNANIRPDFVVKLPENKHYVVDSKVSLTAYEQYFNAEDENAKEAALKEHIRSIKAHIKNLSEKQYERINELNSPDFVFMFIPIEPALTVVLQREPSLMEEALKRNVMPVVPSTLLVTMRTVAYIWKLDNQNKNVQEIAKIGGELYDKFVLFSDNMIKVGNQMDTAKNTYQDAMSQLTKKNSDGSNNAGTILGKIENLKKLGANATKQINQNLLLRAEA